MIEGGTEWKLFRRGEDKYAAANGRVPAGSKSQWRLGDSDELLAGDTFYVDFDMSGFDPNNPSDQKVMDEYRYFNA